MNGFLWAGSTTMRVYVDRTPHNAPGGKFDFTQSKVSARPVYAVINQGGAYRVVVADDDGKLITLDQDYFRVAKT